MTVQYTRNRPMPVGDRSGARRDRVEKWHTLTAIGDIRSAVRVRMLAGKRREPPWDMSVVAKSTAASRDAPTSVATRYARRAALGDDTPAETHALLRSIRRLVGSHNGDIVGGGGVTSDIVLPAVALDDCLGLPFPWTVHEYHGSQTAGYARARMYAYVFFRVPHRQEHARVS